MGDGLCKKCKGLPHPSAQFSLIVVWPYHVTPLFHASFSQRFHFCHYFFSKILLSIGSHILDAVILDITFEGIPLPGENLSSAFSPSSRDKALNQDTLNQGTTVFLQVSFGKQRLTTYLDENGKSRVK